MRQWIGGWRPSMFGGKRAYKHRGREIMNICVAANLEKRSDWREIQTALESVYEDDPRPYDISLFADPCCSRLQVRLDTGTSAGELSANIALPESETADQLVSQIRESIEQLLDEVDAIAG